MYINGNLITNLDREKIFVINPATEEVLGKVFRGNTQDSNDAIATTKHAFIKWKFTPASERAAMLHQAAAKLRDHQDELGRHDRGAVILPGDPERLNKTNYYTTHGKVERSRRIDQTEFYQLLTYTVYVDLNAKLDGWKSFYNYNRPHIPLDMKTSFEVMKSLLKYFTKSPAGYDV
jgi:transposase InsO family protein